MTIDLKSNKNLTRNDINIFFKNVYDRLESLEEKNSWDFSVNDMETYIFFRTSFFFNCFDSLIEENFGELIEYDIIINYPKVKDLLDLSSLIIENLETSSLDDKIKNDDINKNIKSKSIYEYIKENCESIINQLY